MIVLLNALLTLTVGYLLICEITPVITEIQIFFQYFVCPHLFSMTVSILLSVKDTSVAHISGEMFCHSSFVLLSSKHPKGVLYNSSRVTYLDMLVGETHTTDTNHVYITASTFHK